MAGDARKLQPIIIKRVKKGGHGHHGGAWKIAYADFVTAMMAFFLLMWLLGSTSEGDKKGIADFFNSPLKVAMLGGSGAGDATSIIKGGGEDLSRQSGQVRRSDAEARRSAAKQQVRQEQRRAEAARLDALKDKVRNLLATTPKLAAVRSQVRLDTTPDGLRIQIVDEQSRAMFDSGSAAVKPWMRDLLRLVADVLAEVPNRIVVEGHTDAAPFGRGGGSGGDDGTGYGNWELSSDRANASRRELVAGGLSEGRVLRVLGLAASLPYDPKEPAGAVNRRIGIVVLNREAEDRLLERGAPAAGTDADNGEPAPPAAPPAPTLTSAPPSSPTAPPLPPPPPRVARAG